MTATAHRQTGAFLRRAGLVAAVLAIIAGIFGMHVLTGTHAMHFPDTAGTAMSTHHAATSADHTGHPAAAADLVHYGASADQSMAGTTVKPCSDSGDCTSMQAMTTACTPSATTASMAAPPPGTNVLGNSNNTAAGAVTGQWSYLPGSPSPCELSISRT